MSIRKVVVVSAIAMLLAGCAPQGVDNPDSRIANLKDGKTRYDQVLQEFGKPLTEKVAPDGTRTLTFAIQQQQASSAVHSPILGPFSGSVTQVENDLTMKFDKQGVMTSHSSSIKPASDTSIQQQ